MEIVFDMRSYLIQNCSNYLSVEYLVNFMQLLNFKKSTKMLKCMY